MARIIGKPTKSSPTNPLRRSKRGSRLRKPPENPRQRGDFTDEGYYFGVEPVTFRSWLPTALPPIPIGHWGEAGDSMECRTCI
jgi:hypothetical protein